MVIGDRSPRWEYRGRWALVTGASAGLGAEFAHALARRGMHLVLAARRETRLVELARELGAAHGIQAVPITTDLAEPGAARELWDAASREADIHLLVNNAGFGVQGLFAQLPVEAQAEMVRVNCTAVLELAHHALAAMSHRHEGGIVNVSSVAAFQPVPNMATYGATKAFVLSLSQALWAEARPAGVRVLALCPGRTPTEFQERAGTGSAEGAFGLRDPEEVVAAGLRALERGRIYHVPGLENYLATWLVRVMPRSPLTRALKALVRRAASR